MIGLIDLDIFDTSVAVFGDDEDRVRILKDEGCDAEAHSVAAMASAHLDFTPSGEHRISLVLKPEATRATWAHECCHVADFVCDVLGIPISLDNTEIRAYLVGHLMACLEEIMGGDRVGAVRSGEC